MKIRFIAEALNVTNTTQFGFIGSSATTLSSSQPVASGSKPNPTTPISAFATTANTTGALAQINYSRIIQMGGRIFF